MSELSQTTIDAAMIEAARTGDVLGVGYSAGYQIDVSRGATSGAVSSQWCKRPAHETFESMSALHHFTESRYRASESRVVDTRALEIVGETDPENPSRGFINLTDLGTGKTTTPTHHSFAQLARLGGAPAAYVANLPAGIAADCLNWGIKYERSNDLVQVLDTGESTRALTGPDYGRIWHHEIVDAIQNMNRRTGDRFKIPGMIDWGSRHDNGTYTYDPEAKGDSTLFASDRDMFGFLCDDRNPIQIGTLKDGSPDLVFRGFYFWNSEEGTRTAGIAAFYLRGICKNRCLWGVEGFQEFKIRHTKFAPDRFADEAAPALESFCEGRTSDLLAGVAAARDAKVADDNDSMLEFLNKRASLSLKQSKAAIARHETEEGFAPRSVWDAAQAITALARDVPNQDSRITLEQSAGRLLDKVAA